MAIILSLEKNQYVEGEVRLYRGDAWNLDARVIDRVGSVDTRKDLTGGSVTAYFPATGGGTVTAIATLTDAADGRITIPVSSAITPTVDLAQNGIQLYCVLDGVPASGNLTTARMLNPDLVILDREFQST